MDFSTTDDPTLNDDELPEIKQNIIVNLTTSAHTGFTFINEVSSFKTIMNRMIYILRFINNCRKIKQNRQLQNFTTEEISHSIKTIIKIVQLQEFENDIKALTENKELPSNSKLKCLNVFLDTDNILRVGGRIRHSKLAVDQKHQYILPKNHNFTTVLIRHLHVENLHVGQSGLLAQVRQRYWPIGAKRLIHKIVHQCITCYRSTLHKPTQFMGDLPAYRVTPTDVFRIVGLDYAGPILIKSGIRKTTLTKAYIAIFVCMATKAVHIEIVSDMTANTFIASLHRFVSRRGIPSQILSDNGSTFVKANSDLAQLFELFNKDREFNNKIQNFCTVKQIEWKFIPPYSPHFGGLWESMVKSVKLHLKRVIGNSHLNYEEMSTLLCQIESIINSRPLTSPSNDPNDLSFITPGHFLIGRELTSICEPSYTNTSINRLSRWHYLQQLKQHFWNRWQSEYLSNLQQRAKWFKHTTTIKCGQLVLIRDDNLPPQRWKLGRILETHPGKDNIVRVVSIITTDGIIKRSFAKIAILPIDSD